MNKDKLLLILKTFSEKELFSFQDFLQSPFFNKNKQATELFLALRPFFPDRITELQDKLHFFRTQLPHEDWDTKKIGYLMSQLNQLAESFLAIQHLQNDEPLMMLHLMDSLSQKRLEKAYQQINRKYESQFGLTKHQDRKRFFDLFRHAEIQEANFGRTRQRKEDQTIQKVAYSLDRYYYAYRLHIACNMLDRQAILNTQYDLQLSQEWITHLKEQHYFEEPIIEIYYTIFQTLTEKENQAYFNQLKILLETHHTRIATQELSDIYLFSINYCARQIRKGKTAFIQEALNLYLTGIENKALYKDGHLSPWTFTNVVKLFLGSKAYEQAEHFITKYKEQLPSAFGENAVHYNLAELYYFTQRYHEAQEQLNQVAYTDLNFYLGARELLAKIYYDTGEEEALLSLIASFTIFLKRNKKISQNIKTPYLNFRQILFKIVRQSKRDKASLPDEIANTTSLASRAWLKRIYEVDVVEV